MPKFNYAKTALIAALLLMGKAFGQGAEKDPVAIVEVGGAGEWGLKGGGSSYGPTVAVEVTPIEHWLELEAGVTPLFGSGQREWDIDLLFKKPWTLSPTVEFMFGIGPEWEHIRANGQTTNSISAEVAGDFMFWPKKRRRFGWYLEPSYGYSFRSGHEQSLGVSGGLLIAIPSL
jgi:hypothetical protein